MYLKEDWARRREKGCELLKAAVEAGQGQVRARDTAPDELRVVNNEAPNADVGKGISGRGSF